MFKLIVFILIGRVNIFEEIALLSDSEVSHLDSLGVPDALTDVKIAVLTKRLREAYHEDVVVCAVCDEFCMLSESVCVRSCDLPKSFFNVLVPPSGKTGNIGSPIRVDALLEQYNVGKLFV